MRPRPRLASPSLFGEVRGPPVFLTHGLGESLQASENYTQQGFRKLNNDSTCHWAIDSVAISVNR
jgi:hypothetical protein